MVTGFSGSRRGGACTARCGRALLRRAAGAALLTLAAALAVLPAAAQDSPEERLWRQIESLTSEPASSQPYAERLAQAPARNAAIVQAVRSYQLAYPGGPRRDEALRIELAALYEDGALAGGDFAALRARLGEIEQHPPTEAARAEAAYWKMVVERVERPAAASAPSSAPALSADAEWIAQSRAYLSAFPTSPHVPRLAAAIFDDAASREDAAGMDAVCRHLAEHFPDHGVAHELAARRRLLDAVGKTFWLAGRDAAAQTIDTRTFAGRPVVIVIWARFEPASIDTLKAIESERAAQPEIAVVGVNIDERVEDMQTVTRAVSIAWPQVYDGMGWASEFLRAWGLRAAPTVLVLDREGRLLGLAERSEAWRPLLERAARRP